MTPLKAEIVNTGHYKVLAIPFGGPIQGKDMDGDYFSPRTDVKPDWFPERPVLFHHGQDRWVGDAKIGTQGAITKARDGWWGDIWLDRSNKYLAEVESLIAKGRMFGSSATMEHLIKKASDGEILVWPHVEQTLSPKARNTYAVVRATKALIDFEEAGIEIAPAVADILAELEALSTDLRPNLGSPGGGAAKSDLALTSALDELQAVLGELRSGSGD